MNGPSVPMPLTRSDHGVQARVPFNEASVSWQRRSGGQSWVLESARQRWGGLGWAWRRSWGRDRLRGNLPDTVTVREEGPRASVPGVRLDSNSPVSHGNCQKANRWRSLQRGRACPSRPHHAPAVRDAAWRRGRGQGEAAHRLLCEAGTWAGVGIAMPGPSVNGGRPIGRGLGLSPMSGLEGPAFPLASFWTRPVRTPAFWVGWGWQGRKC